MRVSDDAFIAFVFIVLSVKEVLTKLPKRCDEVKVTAVDSHQSTFIMENSHNTITNCFLPGAAASNRKWRGLLKKEFLINLVTKERINLCELLIWFNLASFLTLIGQRASR